MNVYLVGDEKRWKMLLNVAFSELEMKKGKVLSYNRGSIEKVTICTMRTVFIKAQGYDMT